VGRQLSNVEYYYSVFYISKSLKSVEIKKRVFAKVVATKLAGLFSQGILSVPGIAG